MSSNTTYKVLVVPGEPIYDIQGYATGSICTECTELVIRGVANYDRVTMELGLLRNQKGYQLFMEENLLVPIVDTNGAIAKGDYIVRSKRYPTFFEKALVQDFSTRPVGVAVEDRTFDPAMVEVKGLRKKAVKKEMQEIVTEPRVLRRYKLVKLWDESTEEWRVDIEEKEETIHETVYQDVSIRSKDGSMVVVSREPVVRTYEVESEEYEEEVIGEQPEYHVQYIHKNGSFSTTMVNGGFRTCHIRVNLFNYMF